MCNNIFKRGKFTHPQKMGSKVLAIICLTTGKNICALKFIEARNGQICIIYYATDFIVTLQCNHVWNLILHYIRIFNLEIIHTVFRNTARHTNQFFHTFSFWFSCSKWAEKWMWKEKDGLLPLWKENWVRWFIANTLW